MRRTVGSLCRRPLQGRQWLFKVASARCTVSSLCRLMSWHSQNQIELHLFGALSVHWTFHAFVVAPARCTISSLCPTFIGFSHSGQMLHLCGALLVHCIEHIRIFPICSSTRVAPARCTIGSLCHTLLGVVDTHECCTCTVHCGFIMPRDQTHRKRLLWVAPVRRTVSSLCQRVCTAVSHMPSCTCSVHCEFIVLK